MKAKTLIYLGNSLTVVAVIALLWLLWDQELKTVWLQYQSQRQFASQMATAQAPTPTWTPTTIPPPTATPAPVTQTPVHPTSTPTVTPIPRGDYLLEIPSIDVSWMVHHITPDEESDEPWGISKSILDSFGVVDYPHLQFPGENGMVAIAGHSDISGNPFWHFSEVKVDDLVFITRPDGVKLEYHIYRTLTVDPTDQVFWEVQYPKELRLISCLVGSTKQRIMIFAYQVNP